jgi:hypothetical protein
LAARYCDIIGVTVGTVMPGDAFRDGTRGPVHPSGTAATGQRARRVVDPLAIE